MNKSGFRSSVQIVPVRDSGSDCSLANALKALNEFRNSRPALPPLPPKENKKRGKGK